MAKRINSGIYRDKKRRLDQVKMQKETEFVIGGYTISDKRTSGVSSPVKSL